MVIFFLKFNFFVSFKNGLNLTKIRNTKQKYDGQWKAGVQHGEGKMYSSTGEFKSGRWENGNNVQWYEANANNNPIANQNSNTKKG